MTASQAEWGVSGKVYTDPREYDVQSLVMPATKIVKLPLDGTVFSPPRVIISNAPGSATATDFEGNVVTGFPLTGGEQNVAITALSAVTGATAVFGLY